MNPGFGPIKAPSWMVYLWVIPFLIPCPSNQEDLKNFGGDLTPGVKYVRSTGWPQQPPTYGNFKPPKKQLRSRNSGNVGNLKPQKSDSSASMGTERAPAPTFGRPSGVHHVVPLRGDTWVQPPKLPQQSCLAAGGDLFLSFLLFVCLFVCLFLHFFRIAYRIAGGVVLFVCWFVGLLFVLLAGFFRISGGWLLISTLRFPTVCPFPFCRIQAKLAWTGFGRANTATLAGTCKDYSQRN